MNWSDLLLNADNSFTLRADFHHITLLDTITLMYHTLI